MDPISAAASVAGLLTLVVETIKVCNDYIRASKRSGSSAAVLTAELEILLSNLSHLQKFLRDNESKGASFTQTSKIVSRSQLTEQRLRHLRQELERATSSRFKQAIWPLTEKEHRESIQELRNLSQWIQFSLAIDSSSLLSRTSGDVVAVLTTQLETLQQLSSVDNTVETVKNCLIAQTDMLHQTQKDEKRKKILDWISDYDQEQKHNDIKEPRVEKTGEWLLETEAFHNWYHSGKSQAILWCRGVQGSGKSVLTSLVIDKIKTDLCSPHANAALAYFYFDHRSRDSMSSAMVISNLARQLLSTDAVIPKSVFEMYETLGFGKPSLEVAKRLFLSACSANATIMIVLDALDESEENTYRTAFLGFLDKLKHRQDLRLFVTSRHGPVDSPQVFQLQIEAHNSDLERFISQTIEDDPAANTIDSGFKARLVERLIRNSRGLFLLPVLQLRMILEAPSVGEMIEAIDTLPSTVYDAFDVTVSQIKLLPPAKKQLAIKALMWIFYSGTTQHQLRMMDLRQALAVREGQSQTNATFQPSTEMILSCCRGLVTIDNATQHPRFIHQAVQEYLQSREFDHFPDGEALLAKTCLTYLLTEPVGREICDAEEDLVERITEVPFFWYVAVCWGHHVRSSWAQTMRSQTLALLISTTAKSCVQVAQYMMGRNELYWSFKEAESITPLHVAATFGLDEVVNELLGCQNTLDATTSIGTTPLMKASSNGRVAIMRMLLVEGADPYKQNWYGSSLHVAAEANESEAIEVLLQRGMDINVHDSCGRRPLDCALMEKNVEAAATLLRHGASNDIPLAPKLRYVVHDLYLDLRVNAIHQSDASDDKVALVYMIHDKKTGDALHASIEQDNLGFARLLIGNGAAIDRMNMFGLRPLHWTAAKGRLEAARLLLESGTSVNALCQHGHTSYWYATAFEHPNLQQLLMEFGAEMCPEPSSQEKAAASDIMLRDFDKVSRKVRFPEIAAKWEDE